MGGAKAAGVKPPRAFKIFENSFCEIFFIQILPLYPLFTMIAAAPDGAPPRRIGK